MRTIIVGAGAVGVHVAQRLLDEGHDVVILERDPERAAWVDDHLDCTVLAEEGTNPDALRRAGTDGADFFLSLTSSDEVNMIACLLAGSEFRVGAKVARVRNVDYSRSLLLQHGGLGIDAVINPEIEAARAVVDTVAMGARGDVLLFENTDIQLRTVHVDGESFFRDKTLQEVKAELALPFLVVGVIRGEEVSIPAGDTRIQVGDHLQLIAAERTLESVLNRVGQPRFPMKRVLVVGAGRIGRAVAEHLLRRGRSVRFVDRDPAACREAAEALPDALVLQADISEDDIFEAEQLHLCDVGITATGNQELNILFGVYAKSRGVRRAVAVVSGTNYLTIAGTLGIDATVCPKLSAANTVLTCVRRGRVRNVRAIFDGQAEVLEVFVGPGSPLAGRPVRDLALPANVLVAAIARHRRTIVPDGRTVIRRGDLVVLFARRDAVPALHGLLEG